MKISIEVTEEDIKRLVIADLTEKLGIPITEASLKFEVKTKQNYKAEWEEGQFRVIGRREI